MDEIPFGMEFPAGAIRGELYHVYDHTVTYLESGDIDMRGRISPLGKSEDGDIQPATPTPARTSSKRKQKDSATDAPLPKRPLQHTLPAPITPTRNLENPCHEPPPRQAILVVDMVELQYPATEVLGDLTTSTGQQASHAHGLFQTFNNSEKILLALQLLAKVSSTRGAGTLAPGVPTTALSSFVMGPGTGMLAASRLARKFLENSEINPALLRLQTLMCYITLHLTLEYTIVPQLQRENPDWGVKRISGRKYAYFYHILNDNPDGDIDTQEIGVRSKFGVDIGFGKAYWSLLQELGVAALLMLAVGDVGLTVMARILGSGSENYKSLTLGLSRSRVWWSFAHAIGPATIRTLFGPRDIQYTVPQLLQHLRTEPLPTSSISLINQACQKCEIAFATEPPSNEFPPLRWVLEIGEASIKIGRHPHTTPAGPGGLRKVDVWRWLGSVARLSPIFEFLYPPGKADPDEVVNFFCNFYNRRAIPDRTAVPYTALQKLSEAPRTGVRTQQRPDILANEEQSNCDLLVFPAPVNTMVLGVILDPKTTTATIHNWTAQRQLAEAASEVGIFLVKCISIAATAADIMI